VYLLKVQLWKLIETALTIVCTTTWNWDIINQALCHTFLCFASHCCMAFAFAGY
jgi:hypothetical protein